MANDWYPLQVGGGGYTTGIHISDDGLTKLCRIDVFGAYIWNSGTSAWQQIFTQARMPGGTAHVPGGNGNGGCWEIISAPTDSATILAYWGLGDLYQSSDRGNSFTKLTAFVNSPAEANGNLRLISYKMAYDPFDKTHFYVGTESDGIRETQNAGTSFSTVGGITASTSYLIAFDASGGQVVGGGRNGLCKNVYICSYGNQVYKSTDGGASFSQTSGGPTTCQNLRVDTSGILFAPDYSTSLFKYNGTSWTATSPGLSNGCSGVAIDYNNAGHIYAIYQFGNISYSTDRGATWVFTNLANTSRLASDVPWLATVNSLGVIQGMSFGPAQFSKSESNLLYITDGSGVFTTNPPVTNTSYNWTSQTNGIESLNTNGICSAPAATKTPLLYAWDFGLHYSSIPTNNGQNYSLLNKNILACWDVDYAKSNGSTLVSLLASQNVNYIQTSTDNGQTWAVAPANTGVTDPASLTTSGGTAAGSNVLIFASPPEFYVNAGDFNGNGSGGTVLVQHANLPSGTVLLRTIGGSMYLSKDATGLINSGSTINFKLIGQPANCILKTNGSTSTSSNILHFASVPAQIVPGIFAINLSTSASSTGSWRVIAVSSTTVTLGTIATGGAPTSVNVLATVNSGDYIEFFLWDAGGAIAAQTTSNFVVFPSDNYLIPLYTTDGGGTWNACDIGTPRPFTCTSSGNAVLTAISIDATKYLRTGDFLGFGTISTVDSVSQVTLTGSWTGSTGSGIVVTPSSGWSFAYYTNFRNVCADELVAAKYYCINASNSRGQCHISTDGGATWDSGHNTPTPTNVSSFGQLRCAPGTSNLWFSSGTNGIQSLKSSNGTSWSVTTGNGGNAFFSKIGFGKGPLGAGHPTIYANGTVNGVGDTNYGTVWQSDDDGSTWTNISPNTVGNLDTISGVMGDQNVLNQVYVSTSGSGYHIFYNPSGAGMPAFGFSVITDSGQRRTKMIGY